MEHRPIQLRTECHQGAEGRHRYLTEHRPTIGAELRFPPFAHRAFRLIGDRRRGRSVENARPLSLDRGRFGSQTAWRAISSDNDPGDIGPTPLVINGTALTGLSTLCPRRRPSVNQVAVGKGWVTPTTTPADGRSDSRERRPYRTSPHSIGPGGSPPKAPWAKGGQLRSELWTFMAIAADGLGPQQI